MESIEYSRLAERETFFWWNIGRRHILERVLSRYLKKDSGVEILDVGCGPGGNILFLKKFGRVSGIDPSDDAIRFSKNHGFVRLEQGSVEQLPFASEFFDISSALDVIEHVPDDVLALSEMHRVLKPNGILLITVPAHKWLWSRHDEALHHFRRYTRPELTARVRQAGFSVLETSHFVVPAIPFLLIRETIRRFQRRIRKNSEEHIDTYNVILSPFLNSVLIRWLFFEAFFMRFLRIPFGSSLVLIAKKSQERN